ncbi:MAG: response regulator [Methanomassiliicoccus sp.]|nr:response regulator [Methanomassiliicoccus sp.]
MTKLKVLLVEDNAADAIIIKELVKDTGITSSIVWLRDGESVIEHLQDDPAIDAIILDLNMPRLDGHALIEKLREQGVLNKTTVIVMTGSSSPIDRDRVRRAGINSYLIKPMGVREMDETVNALRSIFRSSRACRA